MPQAVDKEAVRAADDPEPPEGGAPFDLQSSPSHLLHRALQFAGSLFDPDAVTAGLTQRQFVVLAAVAAQEGLTQTELVRATGVDRSTLAELIARLVKRGLLDRERDALDARANMVRLTYDGRAALAAGTPAVAAVDAALLDALPKPQRAQFLACLARLADATRPADAAAEAERAARRANPAGRAEKAGRAAATPAARAEPAGKRGKKKKAKAQAEAPKAKKAKKQKSK